MLSKDELMKPELYGKSETDSDVINWLHNSLMFKGSNSSAQISVIDTNLHYAEVYSSSLSLDIHLQEYIQTANDINFDVLHLETLTNGHALYHLANFYFQKFHIGSRLKVNPVIFERWITQVEKSHQSNPYHNTSHSADVLYILSYFISRYKIRSHLTAEDIFSCVIAAIIHDYLHPGVNNSFMIATSHPLALRYNDKSILESYHAASFFEMMNNPEFDILAGLTIDQRKYVRDLIISMTLSIDMSAHFDWIGKFKTKISTTGILFDQKQDKKVCLNMAIKCADHNYCAKPISQCRKWTQLIMNEFFLQGDTEKKLGLDVSAFMNRESTEIPKCQLVQLILFFRGA